MSPPSAEAGDRSKGPRTIDSGLCWPENPRWRGGALYYVDVFAGIVYRWEEGGGKAIVAEVPGGIVGGIGFLPDGDLLAVACHDRRIYRFAGGSGPPEVYVDLGGMVEHHLNDMCVDRDGGIYVGNYGWDMQSEEPPRPTRLLYVSPSAETRWVGGEIWFPNGTMITPDRRLIVIESYGWMSPAGISRIVEHDVRVDGDLENERSFWEFDTDLTCDGACLDSEGAVWAGTPFDHAFIRVERGVGITDRIDLGDTDGIAPALGGDDGRTLFLLQAEYDDLGEVFERRSTGGSLTTTRAKVPAASPPSP